MTLTYQERSALEEALWRMILRYEERRALVLYVSKALFLPLTLLTLLCMMLALSILFPSRSEHPALKSTPTPIQQIK